MFKENELVMYGSTGVCRVTQIGKPEFAAKEDKLYYFLQPLYQNGLIYAPVEGGKVDMRPLISKEEATSLMEGIGDIQADIYRSASLQQLSKHYQDMIDRHHCGTLLELTKSIRAKEEDAKSNNKKLGQIDRKFMKKAEELLYGEIAAALDKNRDEVEVYIKKKMAEE